MSLWSGPAGVRRLPTFVRVVRGRRSRKRRAADGGWSSHQRQNYGQGENRPKNALELAVLGVDGCLAKNFAFYPDLRTGGGFAMGAGRRADGFPWTSWRTSPTLLQDSANHVTVSVNGIASRLRAAVDLTPRSARRCSAGRGSRATRTRHERRVGAATAGSKLRNARFLLGHESTPTTLCRPPAKFANR